MALDVHAIGVDDRGDGHGRTRLDRVACSIDSQKCGALERLSRCDGSYVSNRVMGTGWSHAQVCPVHTASLRQRHAAGVAGALGERGPGSVS